MELKEILAISGQSGLFKFVAQSKNGIIVESLAGGNRFNAPGTSKVSALNEIAIFTGEGEMPLAKLFEDIYKFTDGKEAVSPKADPAELKKFFAEVVPGYDRDRVHVSDMKKIASWFNILIGAGMTKFQAEEETTTSESDEAKTDAAKPKAPAKDKSATPKAGTSKAAPKSVAKSAAPSKGATKRVAASVKK